MKHVFLTKQTTKTYKIRLCANLKVTLNIQKYITIEMQLINRLLTKRSTICVNEIHFMHIYILVNYLHTFSKSTRCEILLNYSII